MATPIEIPIKVTGIAEIKSELKSLKSELVNATDPAEIERLSKAAGQLSDKLTDANEKVKVFAAGSEFEKVSNGLGLIGNQLKDLDFEGASESAKLLTDTIKNMNPSTVAAGFKSLTATVGQLGNAFVQMGIKLLANPIFLIVAIIVAVVAAIVLLKDKVKIIEQAFNLLMVPINLVIKGLKELTDWLGITSFAMEEEADKAVESANRKIAANEKVTASMETEFDYQIALAKANGEDTVELEIKKLQFLQVQAKDRQQLASDTIAAIDKLEKEGTAKLTEEQIKQREEARKNYVIQRDLAKKFYNDRQVLRAEANTKEREDEKTAAEKRIQIRKEADEKLNAQVKKAGEDRTKIERQLTQLRIDNMKDGIQKEIDQADLNQDILIEDLIASETYKNTLRFEGQKKADELLREIIIKHIDILEGLKLKENKRLVDLRLKSAEEEIRFMYEHAGAIKEVEDYIFDQNASANEKLVKAEEEKFKDLKAILIRARETELGEKVKQILEDSKLGIDKLKEQTIAVNTELVNLRQKFTEEDNRLEDERNKNILKNEKNAAQIKADFIADKLIREKKFQEEQTALFEKNNEFFKKSQEFQAETQKKINEGKAEVNKKYKEEEEKLTAQHVENLKRIRLQEVSDAVQAGGQILGEINNLTSTIANEKLLDLQDQYNAEAQIRNEAMNAELANVNLTEQQRKAIQDKYAKLDYEAKLKQFKAEDELKRKAFEADKRAKLIQIVINTAVGIMADFSKGAILGIPMAAITGAIGALQFATVLATKYHSSAQAPTPPSTGGGSSSGSLSIGGAAGSDTSGQAVPNLFGINRLNNITPSGGVLASQEQIITVNAIVSEVEMTTTQKKVQKIEEGSQLGG